MTTNVSSAMVPKAVVALWDAHGLEWEFQKYWNESDRSSYTALNDTEAAPEQPMPLCVFEQEPSSVVTRMSGGSGDPSGINRSEQEISLQFRIHAKKSGSKSGKEIAAELMGFILSKFGGHPTDKAKELVLDNGFVPYIQFVNDFPVRTGDEEFQWTINYSIHIDTPVAA